MHVYMCIYIYRHIYICAFMCVCAHTDITKSIITIAVEILNCTSSGLLLLYFRIITF